jgi:hypothetical protein
MTVLFDHTVSDAPTISEETAGVSDTELTELALAADPDQPIDADAVPWGPGHTTSAGLLPDWYMPSPMNRDHKLWHVAVVVVIISAFLLINALGLCITYGHLVPA